MADPLFARYGREYRPGDVLSAWSPEELQETDSLESALARAEGIDVDYDPVHFHSRITELGVLELWCVSDKADGRWKLEFSVREDAQGERLMEMRRSGDDEFGSRGAAKANSQGCQPLGQRNKGSR